MSEVRMLTGAMLLARRAKGQPTQLDEVHHIDDRAAEILVIGTGRIGIGAYRALHAELGDRVWGMDADRALVAEQRAAGLHVFDGDEEVATELNRTILGRAIELTEAQITRLGWSRPEVDASWLFFGSAGRRAGSPGRCRSPAASRR